MEGKKRNLKIQKKEYEDPKLEIVFLKQEDIITASPGDWDIDDDPSWGG